ncbi:MAG TPA: DUF1887 family CARF protein [Agitococcus sp.]|nr:DUF1887 family CARF protein [Agitococcus sp.]
MSKDFLELGDLEMTSMITHICLLSEQPSPNICPLFDDRIKPDEITLLVTPQQIKRVNDVETVLKKRHIKVNIVHIASAFDAEAVQAQVETLINNQKKLGNKTLINATGGTKPMSIGAFLAGFNHDIPVFYVNNDELTWLHNPQKDEGFEIAERLKLEDFLRMHGLELKTKQQSKISQNLNELTNYLIRHPDLSPSIRQINRIASYCIEDNQLNYLFTDKELANQTLQATLDKFVDAELIKLKGHKLSFSNITACRWCAGLWLEDFVYQQLDILKKLPELQIQDLAESVEVIYANKARSQSEKVDNEIDVIFLADNRLYVIECKTKVYSGKTSNNASEAIYKLATLKRELGGSQAKAMFVSYYPVRDEDKRRADLLGVEICTGRQLQELSSRLKKWIKPF